MQIAGNLLTLYLLSDHLPVQISDLPRDDAPVIAQCVCSSLFTQFFTQVRVFEQGVQPVGQYIRVIAGDHVTSLLVFYEES